MFEAICETMIYFCIISNCLLWVVRFASSWYWCKKCRDWRMDEHGVIECAYPSGFPWKRGRYTCNNQRAVAIDGWISFLFVFVANGMFVLPFLLITHCIFFYFYHFINAVERFLGWVERAYGIFFVWLLKCVVVGVFVFLLYYGLFMHHTPIVELFIVIGWVIGFLLTLSVLI